MHSRRKFLTAGVGGGALALISPVTWAATPVPTLTFVSNPLADYLQLLFFRTEKKRIKPFAAPGFADLPRMGPLVAVPEAVASAGLTRYEQLAPFVAEIFAALPAMEVARPFPKKLCYSVKTPTLDEVQRAIAAGAPFFEPFMEYYQTEVAPQVAAQIDQWREQDAAYRPLEQLSRLHRLSLRGGRVQMVAMPFHPAGSANYSPTAVYSSLFREPDLGWVLGHEGSHLMWSGPVGADWQHHPRAAAIQKRARKLDVDVEETMCMHMQFALSKAVGKTEPAFSIAAQWPDGRQKTLLTALEADWPAYLRDEARWPTLIDYVLDKADAVLS